MNNIDILIKRLGFVNSMSLFCDDGIYIITFSKKNIISLPSVHTLLPELIRLFLCDSSKMNPDGMATDSTAGPETLKSFLQLHLKYVIQSMYKSSGIS